jgi:S-formylglutathione hydrolase
VRRYRHASAALGCEMHFHVFFPPAPAPAAPAPLLYFLSGLTCTDENFIQKAGAQRAAAAAGLALVAPDTSPRGLGIEGEDESWDFGSGAGFYVDATREPWARNYRMYTYVLDELPAALRALPGGHAALLDPARASISGHSMGGHGALVLALRNPGAFASASAFAPICNPSAGCPWGRKALSGYLGDDTAAWKAYDAAELAAAYTGPRLPLLVDTGSADEFLEAQLRPEALEAAAAARPELLPLVSNRREGYDHSYYFIASFVSDHVAHAARALGLAA